MSKAQKVLRFVLISLAFLGITVVFAILLFTFFKSPKEKMQARELEYMKLQYEIMNDRLDNLEVLMTDMEQRDNNLYRVMFEADPIPSSLRRSGFSGTDRYADLYGYKNSTQVVSAARKLDVIASQLYNQSVSYDTLFALARNKSTMLAHIPAIFPLKGTDIKYISSYFGHRPDPIYKVEKFHSGIDFRRRWAPRPTLRATAWSTMSRKAIGATATWSPSTTALATRHGMPTFRSQQCARGRR